MAENLEFELRLKDMMSGSLAGVEAKINGLDSKLNQMSSKGGSVSKWGMAMSVAAGGLITQGINIAASAIKSFTTGSLEAWDVQEKAVAQVRQGIISTGGAAKLSLNQLTDAASDLQSKTIFGDEAILKDVTAQFLTFGNIQGDVFLKGQKLALDLATRLDGDLKGSAIQLGKALDNPVHGITALAKSGVSFTEQEKETIKTLVESGKTVEAQTMILESLEKQYGGSAEAARKAGLGGWTAFKNSLGDMQEELGGSLMPLLNKSIGMLNDKMLPVIKGFMSAIGGFFAWIGENVEKLGQVFSPLLDAVMPIVDAVRQIGEDLGFANSQGSILTSVFNTIGSIIKFISPLIKGVATVVSTLVKGIFDFGKFLFENVLMPIGKFLNKLLPKKFAFENLDFGFKNPEKKEQEDVTGLGMGGALGVKPMATSQQSKVAKSEVDKIQSRQPSNVYINIDAIIKGDVNNVISNVNNPQNDLNNFLVSLENALLGVVNDVNLVLK